MRSVLVSVLVIGVMAVDLVAQTTQDYQKNSSILVSKDLTSACQPQDGDISTGAVKSCCGAPGQRQCVTGLLDSSFVNFLTGCAQPPSDNKPRGNPYNTGGPSISDPTNFSGQWTTVCNMKDATCDDSVASLAQQYSSVSAPLDLNFFVTSDIHPFRSTLRVNDIVYHVRALNELGGRHLQWPAETGIAPGTLIPDPMAVVIPGDLTTHGYSADLGAFRMLWEHGSTPGSIRFPTYPGLGNHDDSSNSTHNDAWRMFDYIGARMSCGVHLDPISDNYSWDWNGLHLVELNTWMGEDSSCSLYPHGSGEDWFKADLQKLGRSGRPVIIFQHYPKSSVAGACGWDVGAHQRFLNIIADYNVIGVIAGHTHNVASDWDNTTDSFGNSKVIDWFEDGKGGGADVENNEDSNAGHGDFFAVHVTDHYLDVGALTWHRNSSRDFTPALGDYSAPALEKTVFQGSSPVCHKRINDRFIDVTSLVSLNLQPAGPGSFVVLIRNGVTAVPGPLALKIAGVSKVTNRSFTDNCNVSASPYVLVGDDSGLASGQSLPVTVTVPAGENPVVSLVRISPLGLAVPNKFELVTSQPVVSGAPLIPPSDQTFTVYGPPNKPYTLSAIDLLKEATPSWMTFKNGSSGAFDRFGRAFVTVSFNGDELKKVTTGNVLSQIHTLWAEPQGDAAVDLSIAFKHGLNVSLSSSAGTSALPATKVTWTAALTYMPFPLIVDGDTQIPGGTVELRERFVAADGTVTSQLLSTTRVNSTSDCQGRRPNGNTVVFGDFGDGNFCPSQTAGGATPFVFSLPVGLHRIYASYTGSGLGDSTFAPADSPVVLFRVGNPLSDIQLISGSGQTTVPSGTFDLPLRARVVDAQGNGVSGATVSIFSQGSQNGGAGAAFGGSYSQTVYTDSQGFATTPLPVANSVTGSYAVLLSINFQSGDQFGSKGVPFILQNQLVTGKPNLLAVIGSKTAPAAQETWTFQLRNLGSPAYDVWLMGINFTQTGGTACTPGLVTPFPVHVPSILTATSVSQAAVAIDFSGCDTSSKFTVQVRFSANAGSYSGVTALGNQFR